MWTLMVYKRIKDYSLSKIKISYLLVKTKRNCVTGKINSAHKEEHADILYGKTDKERSLTRMI